MRSMVQLNVPCYLDLLKGNIEVYSLSCCPHKHSGKSKSFNVTGHPQPLVRSYGLGKEKSCHFSKLNCLKKTPVFHVFFILFWTLNPTLHV